MQLDILKLDGGVWGMSHSVQCFPGKYVALTLTPPEPGGKKLDIVVPACNPIPGIPGIIPKLGDGHVFGTHKPVRLTYLSNFRPVKGPVSKI